MLKLARFAAPGLVALLVTPALADPDDTTRPRPSLPSPAELAEQIDELMEATWKASKVRPQKDCHDSEFLRRAALDITGAIPDEEMSRRFLLSKNRDKRAELVRELLDSKGYARSMATRWAYLLVGREYLFRGFNLSAAKKLMGGMNDRTRVGAGLYGASSNSDEPAPLIVEFLEQQLADNEGWDDVATELLTAEGRSDENPATNYLLRYARDGKAEEMTGNVLRVFQGLQMQCAQCHDHPYADYSQRDFYGVAAFFARTGQRAIRQEMNGRRVPIAFVLTDKGGYRGDRPNNAQIRIPAGEGETGPLVFPRFLTGKMISPGANVDRRAELAKLITADDNPWFAKATVNRVWSFYFGRGLMTPVDDIDMAEVNPHPEVVALLSEDFKRSGYDMRRLSEAILLTRAYGLSSAGDEDDRAQKLESFAQAPVRSLSAEQLFYSVYQATGISDLMEGESRTAMARRLERQKYGMLRTFLSTFGDDEGEEVVDQGTIPQALLMLNGPLTNDAVSPRRGHPLYDSLFAMPSVDDRIEEVYFRVLSRPPSKQERRTVKRLLSAADMRTAEKQAQAWAAVVWALLNSPEFALNH